VCVCVCVCVCVYTCVYVCVYDKQHQTEESRTSEHSMHVRRNYVIKV
jgi:hypothetical protein